VIDSNHLEVHNILDPF